MPGVSCQSLTALSYCPYHTSPLFCYFFLFVCFCCFVRYFLYSYYTKYAEKSLVYGRTSFAVGMRHPCTRLQRQLKCHLKMNSRPLSHRYNSTSFDLSNAFADELLEGLFYETVCKFKEFKNLKRIAFLCYPP